MHNKMNLPDFRDVDGAYERLKDRVVRTPLLRADALDAAVGRPVFVKAECLQKTGSFKYRGASNRVLQLTDAQRKTGVVAFSSGNHAQGMAAAAAEAKVPVVIIMPKDAPAVKIEGVRDCGAQIVLYDRYHESREEIGARMAAERNAVLVSSYDDPMIIAGQGSAGIEAAQQLQEFGVVAEALITNAGGGGLTAGLALAWEELCPIAKIYTAEPDDFDDHKRSFAAGERQSNASLAGSACDALLTPEPGHLTFTINKTRVCAGLSASDEEAFAAMRFAFRHLKIVLEPGGAIALACALQKRVPGNGPLCVFATGGNVEPALFAKVLGAA